MQGVLAEKRIFNERVQKRPTLNEHSATKGSRVIVTFLVVATVVIFCSLFYVWFHMQVVNIGYEISLANMERKELLQLNKKLKLEIATLTSPHHIESIAKNELRLRSPKSTQVVIVK